MPLTTLPPPLVFDDDLPPVFHNDEVYHEQPGDIPAESWGMIKKSKDFNAKTRDFEAERKAYEHAKRLREGYETIVHIKTMKNFTEGVLNVDELPEDGLMQQIMNVRARNADILELVSKELNHFGVIAGFFRQIGCHSSRFVLFSSF